VTRKRPAAPPRLAELLVALACRREERAFVLGDFRDAFDEHVARMGPREARRWYRREAFQSLLPLMTRRLRRLPSANVEQARSGAGTHLMADVAYAWRLSRRSPLASGAIMTTMALGIAATTAVFSATNAVLLRPLPFPSSDRVVQLRSAYRSGTPNPFLAYPDLMDFRQGVRDFSDVAVFSGTDATLQHGTDPQLVRTLRIDDAYARVFGLRVALGRLFVPSDTVVNAGKVALLSSDFWTREFGADRSVVGRTITLDNEPVQVVGILASDAYVFPHEAIDLLTPLSIPANSFMHNRGATWANAAAKLRPGASAAQAERDLESVAARLSKEYANSNQFLSARVLPLRDAVVGSVQSMLELLAAAMAAVLLIACTNIANLILGRAQTRTREFAVRSALGGSPARVRRQVVTESLVLASIGGIVGLLLAPVLTHTLIAVYPDALPRADEVGVDARVVVVAVAATLLAGLLSAIPTARRVGRFDLAVDLRAGARAGVDRGDQRAGRVLVVTQVAASLALLFAAGLLLRTFWGLTRLDPGFQPRHALAFHVYPPSARYKSPAEIDRYYERVIGDLRAIPGVRSVSSTTALPFGGGGSFDGYIDERRGDLRANNPLAFISIDTPGFELALGIPVVRGRAFTPQDDSAGEHVVLINEALARRDYAGLDPVGHFITWNGQPHWRIAGVLGTTRMRSLDEEPIPVLYVPETQATRRSRYLVVRSDASADQVVAAARSALRRIDPTIALADVATMERRIDASVGAQRFRAVLMATLGAQALVLALVGIYSVVGYSVSRRTREIGIRMALGEARRTVRRRVVLDAFRGAALGLAIGVILAVAGGKWLTSFLVGVNPHDIVLLGAATLILAAVVFAAAYGPARRAARVDPIEALRAD
jgi:predicted permease